MAGIGQELQRHCPSTVIGGHHQLERRHTHGADLVQENRFAPQPNRFGVLRCVLGTAQDDLSQEGRNLHHAAPTQAQFDLPGLHIHRDHFHLPGHGDAVLGLGRDPHGASWGNDPDTVGGFHGGDTRGGVDQLIDIVPVRGDFQPRFVALPDQLNGAVQGNGERKRVGKRLAVLPHILTVYAATVSGQCP